ncbi:unnamed protein product [Paramecium pentaurelia]|uniref:VIT domain-containing protein n=1 Tax=Paramecium pentaurelia TaxID=43138 RepID=A0A8S1UDF8_9CILI|nr:unnamed protein product [Paramecium pentaurelia]
MYSPKLDDKKKSSLSTIKKKQAQFIMFVMIVRQNCLQNQNILLIYNLVQQQCIYVKSIQLNKTDNLFTIDQNSEVTKMIVELGGQKVDGVVKELEEAKKVYEKGIQEGKTVVLIQEDSKISNIKKQKLVVQALVIHQQFNLNASNNYKYFQINFGNQNCLLWQIQVIFQLINQRTRREIMLNNIF